MIYITQLIYVKQGKEAVFQEFESHAIPIIAQYNGQLMMRLRPDSNSVIEAAIEQPYEVHIIKFLTQSDFDEFLNDEQRKQFLDLKEQSIKETLLIKGEAIS